MNISSISANSGFNRAAFYDKAINMLEKQKERIHAQIQKINESDMDKNTKQEYIKVLKTQIDMIETQIQQKRTEKMTQAAKQKAEKQTESGGSQQGEDQNSAYKADLIKADDTAAKADVLNVTRDKLNGRGEVLSQEIALDAGRGAAVGAKQEELQKLETSKWKLDGKVGEALGTAETEAERGKPAETDSEDQLSGSEDSDEEYRHEKKKKIDLLV